MLIYKCPLKVGLLSVTFELKRRHFSAIAELLFCTSVSAGFVELTVSRVLFVSAAGLAMLIAQGTTQMVAAETTTVANSSPPITVETKPASAPNELSALMSTTALVASTPTTVTLSTTSRAPTPTSTDSNRRRTCERRRSNEKEACVTFFYRATTSCVCVSRYMRHT